MPTPGERVKNGARVFREASFAVRVLKLGGGGEGARGSSRKSREATAPSRRCRILPVHVVVTYFVKEMV
jgi:hypothetical protein